MQQMQQVKSWWAVSGGQSAELRVLIAGRLSSPKSDLRSKIGNQNSQFSLITLASF
jgi:hypothetical protein